MSAQTSIQAKHTELIKLAAQLWARTASAGGIASDVAPALPTEFEPESLKTNLGLCCRLLQWALLETSSALETLKARQAAKLHIDNYIVTCEQQHERLRACLAMAMAIGELMRHTDFDDQRLLLAGLMPDLDELAGLVRTLGERAAASRTGARQSSRAS